MLLPMLLACTPAKAPTGSADRFVVAPADLGAPRADATGFDPADGDALGMALAAVLPAFGESNPLGIEPAEDIPNAVWALLQDENVRNAGVCPFDSIEDDGTTVHEGDCRSSYGYEFTGDVGERDWTDDDGFDRTHRDFDVDVIGDADSALFDRVAMHGATERAYDGEVVHVDVNLEIAVDGYWERRDANDPNLAAWSTWTVSGALEGAGDDWTSDLAADVAGSGGMGMASGGLVVKSTCPTEATGDVDLGGGATAAFEGAASCDRCAHVTDDAGVDTRACAPG